MAAGLISGPLWRRVLRAREGLGKTCGGGGGGFDGALSIARVLSVMLPETHAPYSAPIAVVERPDGVADACGTSRTYEGRCAHSRTQHQAGACLRSVPCRSTQSEHRCWWRRWRWWRHRKSESEGAGARREQGPGGLALIDRSTDPLDACNDGHDPADPADPLGAEPLGLGLARTRSL
jgi:hypothetical protein